MKQRVARHKDGHVGIAGLFVDGEELFLDARTDDKAVCGKPTALVLGQGEGDPDVAQVGGDWLLFECGHSLHGGLHKLGECHGGAGHRRRGRLGRGALRRGWGDGCPLHYRRRGRRKRLVGRHGKSAGGHRRGRHTCPQQERDYQHHRHKEPGETGRSFSSQVTAPFESFPRRSHAISYLLYNRSCPRCKPRTGSKTESAPEWFPRLQVNSGADPSPSQA